MGNIVLADEINRTSPKTQSALLEGMAEANVTVDGEIHTLPNPFFVMATQNPIEHEGTYPLPEAQLDRFLIKVKMGYPDFQQEMKLLTRFERDEPIETLESVITRDELLRMKEAVKDVHVSQPVKKYIVQLVQATRTHASLYLGASPRSSIALMKVAQAWAYMEGRSFVLPDDVKELLTPVLSHRLILTADARYHGQTAERILEQVKKEVAVPIQQDVESL
jgi:MoxR-like ATPase